MGLVMLLLVLRLYGSSTGKDKLLGLSLLMLGPYNYYWDILVKIIAETSSSVGSIDW